MARFEGKIIRELTLEQAEDLAPQLRAAGIPSSIGFIKTSESNAVFCLYLPPLADLDAARIVFDIWIKGQVP